MKNKSVLFLFSLLAATLFTSIAFGQDAPTPVVAATGVAAVLSTLLPLLTPIVSLAITQLVKYVAPHISGIYLPIIASLVGLLPDYVNHLATGAPTNSVQALLLGGSATWLHQLSTQLKSSNNSTA